MGHEQKVREKQVEKIAGATAVKACGDCGGVVVISDITLPAFRGLPERNATCFECHECKTLIRVIKPDQLDKGKTNGSGKGREQSGNEIMARAAIQELNKQNDLINKAANVQKYTGQKVNVPALLIASMQIMMKTQIWVLDQLLLLTSGEHQMTVTLKPKEEADADVPAKSRLAL